MAEPTLIVISIANVLETILLIAIIVEFVRIFTSKKKNDDSTVSDSIMAAGKKLFGKSEQKIKEGEADTKKKTDDLKKTEENIAEVQRAANLEMLDTKHKIQALLDGTVTLSQTRANTDTFINTLPELKTKIINPMIESARAADVKHKSLTRDIRTSFANLIKDINGKVNALTNTLEVEVTTANKELQVAAKNKKVADGSKAMTAAQKEAVNKKFQAAEANVTNLTAIMKSIRVKSVDLKNDIQKLLLPDLKTQNALQFNAQTSITKIIVHLETLKDAIEKIQRNPANIAEREGQVARFDNALIELKKEIPALANTYNSMFVGPESVSKFNADFKGVVEPKINEFIRLVDVGIKSRKPLV